MNRLLGGAISDLEGAMRFRMTRQAALAANVANADTPGYRRTDLAFSSALEGSTVRLARSHARHLGTSETPAHRVTRGPRGDRPDGNGVDRDQELITLSRNAGAFNDQAEVLARIFVLRRIAATGRAG